MSIDSRLSLLEYAREKSYAIIDDSSLALYNSIDLPQKNVLELTPRQRKIFDFISKEKKVSTQQIINFMKYNSRITAYFALKPLVEKNIIVKEKRGREVFFSIKEVLVNDSINFSQAGVKL